MEALSREEAKRKYLEAVEKGVEIDTLAVIDVIFDSVDSRTCSNCTHLKNGYCVPHQRKIHNIPITVSQKLWIESSGCNNKFKRKGK